MCGFSIKKPDSFAIVVSPCRRISRIFFSPFCRSLAVSLFIYRVFITQAHFLVSHYSMLFTISLLSGSRCLRVILSPFCIRDADAFQAGTVGCIPSTCMTTSARFSGVICFQPVSLGGFTGHLFTHERSTYYRQRSYPRVWQTVFDIASPFLPFSHWKSPQ